LSLTVVVQLPAVLEWLSTTPLPTEDVTVFVSNVTGVMVHAAASRKEMATVPIETKVEWITLILPPDAHVDHVSRIAELAYLKVVFVTVTTAPGAGVTTSG